MPHVAYRRSLGRVLILPLSLLAALAACGREQASGPPAPTVTVANPIAREVTEWDEYSGRFAATDYVEIRSRVGGYLDAVHFADGQMVKKGDLLFVIDPRPYQAAVQAAEATLAQARARLDLADRQLARSRDLVARQNVPVRTVDSDAAEQRSATGAVQAAEAQLRRARLDLEFTEVRAPVTGRASRHLVSVGNLVSGGDANSTLLTTIVTLDPIEFYFDGDQSVYLKYQRLAVAGDRASSRDKANPVTLALADETEFTHQGHMNFVDNQVDSTTGTVRGRAIFDNHDLLLTPGLFARLRLIGSGRYPALLVPDEAIANDQARKIVYVVAEDGTVTPRVVKLGPIVDGLRVVREGLTAQDQIVVKGLQRVRAGLKVKAEVAPPPPAPPTPTPPAPTPPNAAPSSAPAPSRAG